MRSCSLQPLIKIGCPASLGSIWGKRDLTKIISSLNLKGGVGKTTIAVNYAAHCGRKGRKTLLIDLDPQSNASFGSIGLEEWKTHSAKNGTVSDLLGAGRLKTNDGHAKTFDEVIFRDAFKNVDLIPSHLELFTVDLDLAAKPSRERILYKSIKEHIADYSVIICDCPPNLTLPTQNALHFSTHFVVPVSLDYLSVLGIGLLLNRVKSLSSDLDNEGLSNAGVILSRVGRPSRHRQETETTVRKDFGNLVLTGKISDRSAVSKSMEDFNSVFASHDKEAIAEFNYIFAELDKRLKFV